MITSSGILVIADDFSGAAEIAGIAFQFGLKAQIQSSVSVSGIAAFDVTIINSESRNSSREVAALKINEILKSFSIKDYNLLYKKVDSVLRGNVATEINAIMEHTGIKKTLLIPANPTHKRTIFHSHYYIDTIPLENTDFSNDPHFPGTSGDVRKMLNFAYKQVFTQIEIADFRNDGIYIPDINSETDIQKAINHTEHNHTLFAGGADFFRSILKIIFNKKPEAEITSLTLPFLKLFAIGSISTTTKSTLSALAKNKFHIHYLTSKELSNGSVADVDIDTLSRILNENGKLVLSRPEELNSEYIQSVCNTISTTIKKISNNNSITIFAEGGETAAAIVRELTLQELYVNYSNSWGNVMLKSFNSAISIFIKPGSYHWSPQILNTIK